MPAILPVVSNVAISEHGSPPGSETTGSNNGARSEGGVTNDTNGPNQTWTQPSANSEQASKPASFGTVLSASVTGTSKTKAKSSDSSADSTASPADPNVVPTLAVALPALAAQVTLARTNGTTLPGDTTAGQSDLAASTTAVTSKATLPGDSASSDTAQTAGALPVSNAVEALPTQFSSLLPQANETSALTSGIDTSTVANTATAVSSAAAGASDKEVSTTAPSAITIDAPKAQTSNSPALTLNPVTAVSGEHRAASNNSDSNTSDNGSQNGSNGQPSLGASTTTQALGHPSNPISQAAVASSSVAERVSVINQIAQQVSATASAPPANGTQSVTVHVSPEHWGDMSIKLTSNTVDGATGPITATITTQSTAATNALTSHVDDLKSSLAASGIKLDKVEITTADKNVNSQIALATDKATAASNAQGSGLQSNLSGQFSNGQHNSSGSHPGQGLSSAMADQNRNGQGGQHQAFASMLSGDRQQGNRGTGYGTNSSRVEVDGIDETVFASPSFATNSSKSGINVLA